jgi:hypothetical protein
MKVSNKVNANTVLQELMGIPEAVEILAKYNVPCLSCPIAAFEIGYLQIGEVAKIYGIDLNALIKDLNEVLE